MDVRIPLEIGAEGMENRDQTGSVAALRRPEEEGILDRTKEGVQGWFSVHPNPVAQFLGDGEDEVLVGDIEGVTEGGLDPAVDGGLAARGAEAGLAGVGYAAGRSTALTAVFPMPPGGAAE